MVIFVAELRIIKEYVLKEWAFMEVCHVGKGWILKMHVSKSCVRKVSLWVELRPDESYRVIEFAVREDGLTETFVRQRKSRAAKVRLGEMNVLKSEDS